jgi:peptidoglycan hydrolase-like protein with peptidoglycan-binding domain
MPIVQKSRKGLIVGWSIGGTLAAIAVATVLLTVGLAPQADADGAAAKEAPNTATIESGTLTGTTPKTGKLDRPAGPTIGGGRPGTITKLPAVGTILGAGKELYRVDDRPVIAFEGELPQWREFADGMTDGEDIRQLERNLADWGYLKEPPTAHFDSATTRAIKAWQKATGQERTGTIGVGDLEFTTGSFIVSSQSAHVGDKSGGPLYETKRDEKVVLVDLPVGSPLAKVGTKVDLSFPNGGRSAGEVASVGAATIGKDGKTTVPTRIRISDKASTGDLTDASVSVEFVSEVKENVLSVPVLALGAAGGGGFVVEVVGKDGTTRAVPVKTGLFAGDRVEISGDGIAAGQKVVVPKS